MHRYFPHKKWQNLVKLDELPTIRTLHNSHEFFVPLRVRIIESLLYLFYLKCFRSIDHQDQWWPSYLTDKYLFLRAIAIPLAIPVAGAHLTRNTFITYLRLNSFHMNSWSNKIGRHRFLVFEHTFLNSYTVR